MTEETINALVSFIESVKAAIDETNAPDRMKKDVRANGDYLIGCLDNYELPKRKD